VAKTSADCMRTEVYTAFEFRLWSAGLHGVLAEHHPQDNMVSLTDLTLNSDDFYIIKTNSHPPPAEPQNSSPTK
jgi:hypothetical protein